MVTMISARLVMSAVAYYGRVGPERMVEVEVVGGN